MERKELDKMIAEIWNDVDSLRIEVELLQKSVKNLLRKVEYLPAEEDIIEDSESEVDG